jgi:hypothetical protein
MQDHPSRRKTTARAFSILGLILTLSGCDGCTKEIEKNLVNDVSRLGSSSTAGGTVVAFLRDRRDGHSGEGYWRETVEPYPRVDYLVPVAPKDVHSQIEGGNSGPRTRASLRHRILAGA